MDTSQANQTAPQSSQTLMRLLEAELAVQSELERGIEQANKGIAESEEVRRRVSYRAEAQKDAKAIEVLASCNAKLAADTDAVRQKQYALETSKQIQADLCHRHAEAVKREDRLAVRAELQRMIDEEATAIDAHFRGVNKGGKPYVALIEQHYDNLKAWQGWAENHSPLLSDATRLFEAFLWQRLPRPLKDIVSIESYVAAGRVKMELPAQTWKAVLEGIAETYLK